MPDVGENRDYWSNYEWSEHGDEWSVGYGGTQSMWNWAILPRIGAYLPAEHILEIAPGHGRATQYLIPSATRLTLVDLTESCIEACRTRFKEHDNITYHVNDGRSLDMVEDGSVDFVFSWDSLIHVEEDVMEGYIRQLASKLRPGGAGVLHHSNLDTYRDARGELTIGNEHWRASSMSAAKFRGFCRDNGLRCVSQELIPWGGPDFIDCLSVFRKEETGSLSRWAKRTRLLSNTGFFTQVQQRQAAQIRRLARIYRP